MLKTKERTAYVNRVISIFEDIVRYDNKYQIGGNGELTPLGVRHIVSKFHPDRRNKKEIMRLVLDTIDRVEDEHMYKLSYGVPITESDAEFLRDLKIGGVPKLNKRLLFLELGADPDAVELDITESDARLLKGLRISIRK